MDTPGSTYRKNLLRTADTMRGIMDDDSPEGYRYWQSLTPAQRMAIQDEATLAEDLYREACD